MMKQATLKPHSTDRVDVRKAPTRSKIERPAAVKFNLRDLRLLPATVLNLTLAAGIIVMLVRSIRSFDTFTQTLGGVSLEHYVRLFGSETSLYASVLIRTLSVSLITGLVATAFALPVAYYITRSVSRTIKNMLIFCLLLPFLVGETVRAFAWLYFLGNDGVFEWALQFLNVSPPQVIGTTVAVAVGLLQIQIPLASIILITALQRIPVRMEQAATTLGANSVAIWKKIVIPMARKGIIGALIVTFAIGTTEYAIPQVLGLGARPFVANTIHSMVFAQNNMSLGSAYAVTLIVSVGAVAAGLSFALRNRGSRRQ